MVASALFQPSSLVCRWRLEKRPAVEIRIERQANLDLKFSLINTNSNSVLSSLTTPLNLVFDRCIGNLENTIGEIEGKIFSNRTLDKAVAIRIDGDERSIKLTKWHSWSPSTLKTRFIDGSEVNGTLQLKSRTEIPQVKVYSLVDGISQLNLRTEVQQVGFNSSCEEGLIRPGPEGGTEETIKVWPVLDNSKSQNVRLICKHSNGREDLMLKLYNDILGTRVNIKQLDTDPIADRAISIVEKINLYRNKDIAEIRRNAQGEANGVILLENSTSSPARNFAKHLNLATASEQEICRYFKENVLTIRNQNHEELAQSQYIRGVEVKRIEDFDFADGTCTAICVRIQKGFFARARSMFWNLFKNPVVGLLSARPERELLLEEIDKYALKNFGIENLGGVEERLEILQDMEQMVTANATLNWYISIHRHLAMLTIEEGPTYYFSICATSFGIKIRKIWENRRNVSRKLQTIQNGIQGCSAVAKVLGVSVPQPLITVAAVAGVASQFLEKETVSKDSDDEGTTSADLTPGASLNSTKSCHESSAEAPQATSQCQK